MDLVLPQQGPVTMGSEGTGIPHSQPPVPGMLPAWDRAVWPPVSPASRHSPS